MIDRNVEFPNRFRMTKVAGTDDIYDLIPAPGEVIALGDTFSKANMLPDSIPATLGLKMGNPQVKDALNVLANIGNVHVWQRVQTYADPVPEVPAGYTLGDVEENVVLASRSTTVSTNGTFYYYYGDSVTVKNDGTVNAPSSDSWATIGRNVSATTLKSGPLFVKGSYSYISSGSGYQDADVTNEATKVFYIPSGGTLSVTVDSNAKMCYVVATKYQPVTGYPYTPAIPAGTHVDYLTSTDPNAYTEGTVDRTTITYLGQLGNRSRIEVGSYVGTGTYGEDNPNSLTFGFEPKIIWIAPVSGTNISATIRRDTNEGVAIYAATNIYSLTTSWSGNTVTWYTSSKTYQLNGSGVAYSYIALG